ncbi:hypothetical protein [Phyllobacterium endophyticum]|uniref:hypothetical protein n=1 Tax=Phyllobacterium endophyticum TaxID=1149773 RepID=UPI0011CA507B|nr:hypothetical protein [Phyllobacterium endophyticum]TXR47025.1 hypothetical protein FVA77_22170 [Phyllobacterium endophyticum]
MATSACGGNLDWNANVEQIDKWRSSCGGQQTRRLEVTVDGLKADLDSAVEIAFFHGAAEWVRLNYPTNYERLLMGFDKSAPLGERRYLH